MPIFKAIYKALSGKWHPQAVTVVGQMAPAGSDSRPARGNGRALQADFHDDHRERSRCESRHRSPRHGDGLVHELRAHRPCGRPRHVLLHLRFQPSRRGHREGSECQPDYRHARPLRPRVHPQGPQRDPRPHQRRPRVDEHQVRLHAGRHLDGTGEGGSASGGSGNEGSFG